MNSEQLRELFDSNGYLLVTPLPLTVPFPYNDLTNEENRININITAFNRFQMK